MQRADISLFDEFCAAQENSVSHIDVFNAVSGRRTAYPMPYWINSYHDQPDGDWAYLPGWGYPDRLKANPMLGEHLIYETLTEAETALKTARFVANPDRGTISFYVNGQLVDEFEAGAYGPYDDTIEAEVEALNRSLFIDKQYPDVADDEIATRGVRYVRP